MNFLMLVPVGNAANPFALTATRSGNNLVVSFLTQTGFSYQLLYKDNLGPGSWQPLGSPLSGNGAAQSVTNSMTGARRFFRVQVQ